MYKHRLSALILMVLLLVINIPTFTQNELTFFSTQFNTTNEGKKFSDIIKDSGYSFISTEESPLLGEIYTEIGAGKGTIDVIGVLHGTFPPLASAGALKDLSPLLAQLSENRQFSPELVELGHLGTESTQYYIPWIQATYIMTANVDALPYLPEGADVMSLTWDEFADWCKNLFEINNQALCGLPHAGLFHRFLEGYLFPSFTGGTITKLRSAEAVQMMEFMRDDLWQYIHPDSMNYEFMQEPLLSGDVWVAFDHTARLMDAFSEEPDQFIGFPAPSGPAGRSFMPIVVGLGILDTSENIDQAKALIDYLTSPKIQETILNELAFFPVIDGLDMSDLSDGIKHEAEAVNAITSSEDMLTVLPPVGLGEQEGEFNQIYRNAFDRIVLDGEDIQTVLNEEADNLQALLDKIDAPCWRPDPPSIGACQID